VNDAVATPAAVVVAAGCWIEPPGSVIVKMTSLPERAPAGADVRVKVVAPEMTWPTIADAGVAVGAESVVATLVIVSGALLMSADVPPFSLP
jgi:hypothetical protein